VDKHYDGLNATDLMNDIIDHGADIIANATTIIGTSKGSLFAKLAYIDPNLFSGVPSAGDTAEWGDGIPPQSLRSRRVQSSQVRATRHLNHVRSLMQSEQTGVGGGGGGAIREGARVPDTSYRRNVSSVYITTDVVPRGTVFGEASVVEYDSRFAVLPYTHIMRSFLGQCEIASLTVKNIQSGILQMSRYFTGRFDKYSMCRVQDAFKMYRSDYDAHLSMLACMQQYNDTDLLSKLKSTGGQTLFSQFVILVRDFARAPTAFLRFEELLQDLHDRRELSPITNSETGQALLNASGAKTFEPNFDFSASKYEMPDNDFVASLSSRKGFTRDVMRGLNAIFVGVETYGVKLFDAFMRPPNGVATSAGTAGGTSQSPSKSLTLWDMINNLMVCDYTLTMECKNSSAYGFVEGLFLATLVTGTIAWVGFRLLPSAVNVTGTLIVLMGSAATFFLTFMYFAYGESPRCFAPSYAFVSPMVPYCFMDDVYDFVDRYILPRHYEWGAAVVRYSDGGVDASRARRYDCSGHE